MTHHRKLSTVGAVYHLEPKPLNTNVNMNAVATYDGSRKMGNLRRENAAAIVTVIELKSVGNLSLYFTF